MLPPGSIADCEFEHGSGSSAHERVRRRAWRNDDAIERINTVMVRTVLVLGMCGALAMAGNRPPERELAARLVSLARRAVATGVPERLPKDVADQVPEHAREEYDSGVSRYRGMGFFEPALVKGLDRTLYADLKKLWRTPWPELARAVPEF
jgi:hypothetical protein